MGKRYFLNLCAVLIMVSGLTGRNLSWACDPVADVIFHSGTILTVGKDMAEAEAVAVKGGRILGVGSFIEVFRYKSDTKMIDLGGKTLMPGFVEGHSHPFMNMLVDNRTVDIRPVLYTCGPKIMKMT